MTKTRSTGPSKHLVLRISDALNDALKAHCAQIGVQQSELIRTLIAREVGQPELADTITMGRPVEPPVEQPAGEPKKRATKR